MKKLGIFTPEEKIPTSNKTLFFLKSIFHKFKMIHLLRPVNNF